jgi:hypothetical protein
MPPSRPVAAPNAQPPGRPARRFVNQPLVPFDLFL